MATQTFKMAATSTDPTKLEKLVNTFLAEQQKQGWVAISISVSAGSGGYAAWALLQKAQG